MAGNTSKEPETTAAETEAWGKKIGLILGFDKLVGNRRLSLISFFAVVALVLVALALQFRSNLIEPIYGTPAGVSQADLAAADATANVASNPDKAVDTDGDGLSDYDETNIYHTSPYLPDTNGDGIGDLQSVEQGINPCCPKNQSCDGNCQVIPSTSASSTSNLQQTVNNLNPASNLPTTSNSASASSGNNSQVNFSADQINALRSRLGDNPSPAQIRQLMQEAGASASDLSAMSDSDLIQSYNYLISGGQTTTSPPTASGQ